MEHDGLQQLLEEDRERVLANLAENRAPEAVSAALEKAVDRVTYRYMEQCAGDERVMDAAQAVLSALKSMLPLIGAVNDSRRWQAQTAAAPTKKARPAVLAFSIVGLVLIAGTVLGLYFGGRRADALGWLWTLIPALLGCISLFWAGVLQGRPAKRSEDSAEERMEYLIDVDKVWHDLSGAMLMADRRLEDVRQSEAIERQRESASARPGGLSREGIELMSNLLEMAYARQDEDAREMISGIRFFLHGANVDVVDYDRERESWFEVLPAPMERTIRPALTSGGKLIRKGMATKMG